MDMPQSLVGQLALVTGSTAGIGKEVARELHARGADVIVSGRDANRCKHTIQEIKQTTNGVGQLECLPLELTDYDAVRAAAKSLEGRKINFLILHAGLTYVAKGYKGPWLTPQGHDYMLAANVLGHFLLCDLLIPTLKSSPSCRIIITSSIAHWQGIPADLFRKNESHESATNKQKFSMYSTTKLGSMLFAYELTRRLQAVKSDIVVTAITPGLVNTEILNTKRGYQSNTYFWNFAVPPVRGKDTAIYVALCEPPPPQFLWCVPYWTPSAWRREDGSVPWWVRASMMVCEQLQKLTWGPRMTYSSPESYDAGLAARFWEFCTEAVGLKRTHV